MFVTKIKIATAIMLMALTGSACLTWHSSMLAGQTAPIPPTLPPETDAKPSEKESRNKEANKPPETWPIGFVHDFGKVLRGAQLRHAFRIVNTSDVPLRIISLRTS